MTCVARSATSGELEFLTQTHLDCLAVDRGTPAHVLGVDATDAKEVDVVLARTAWIDAAHDVTKIHHALTRQHAVVDHIDPLVAERRRFIYLESSRR